MHKEQLEHKSQKPNRQYDANLAAYMCYKAVQAALREQILTAINNTFLVALEHEELGHIATPQAMIAHLKEEYGELDATEIETNHATLAGAWNPDDHIDELFTHIREAQRLATKANEPITDGAAIRLTITALENTGVLKVPLNCGI
jgi:ferritin